jgi:oligoribonuclease NrnB/cAMP/cGMP phosphodiesterase (DHH superfamily)
MYYIITHTDMDGVGAAALYIYLFGEKPAKIYFTEPYLLYKTMRHILRRIKGRNISKIVLMDLGFNVATMNELIRYIREIRSRNIDIEWYDHHIWDQEWKKLLKNVGVKIYVDRSTCAVGIIAKYAPRRNKNVDLNFIEELVKGVCAGDLWRFDHWRGPWFLRLVKRRDDNNWRLHVLDEISKGNIWKEEFTEKVIERFDKELKSYNIIDKTIVYKDVNGIRIAVAKSIPEIENSFAAAYVMGRVDAEIAATVTNDGKVSLRSRSVNIREIAKIFGGGGHPRASGFKIKIPFTIRLKAFLGDKTIVQNYILEKIIEVISKYDILKYQSNST